MKNENLIEFNTEREKLSTIQIGNVFTRSIQQNPSRKPITKGRVIHLRPGTTHSVTKKNLSSSSSIADQVIRNLKRSNTKL